MSMLIVKKRALALSITGAGAIMEVAAATMFAACAITHAGVTMIMTAVTPTTAMQAAATSAAAIPHP